MECPPSATADAQLGYSVTAYKSAAILFGSREGDSSVLARLKGTCKRAHQGEETESAQQAKVGVSPFCARPTHIAVPNRYAAGEFSKEKGRGLSS